jgi:hypothetical protein
MKINSSVVLIFALLVLAVSILMTAGIINSDLPDWAKILLLMK